MTKILLIFTSLFLLLGCDNSSVLFFEELPKEGWVQEDWVSFDYRHRLPEKDFAVNWILRHDDNYPYANIHLIAEWRNPKGTTFSDTLSYLLASPDGSWLGKGLYIKAHTLPFLERYLLDEPGNYTFRVRPAVRANDALIAEKTLKGIHQIGIELIPISND